ncbi:nucleoside 2-deoxyribosyltransferase [Propionivibrio sp.]|uniref:nucleoside 2-deoxyribosyltransferase n=1 Tax=Propionivibrio sp. TaxID=2212460 RepID=UPI003BF2B76B
MKIYLAGPDVFRPDVLAWAESARELCLRYGFKPLLPIDHGEDEPERIFQANIAMIRKAQIVVANLDPFRGSEPDSGTAFELGYALALGKKICGYVTRLDTLAKRVEIAHGQCALPAPGAPLTDGQGMLIENFNLPCNLMLAIPSHIVEGGLEACLQAIRARPAIA